MELRPKWLRGRSESKMFLQMINSCAGTKKILPSARFRKCSASRTARLIEFSASRTSRLTEFRDRFASAQAHLGPRFAIFQALAKVL